MAVESNIIWVDAFVDHKTGVISIVRFNPFDLETTELMKLFSNETPHGLVIVDYKLKKSGDIEWLLLRNSWGERAGDRGYYHIGWSTFLDLVNEVML